ncbi:MAG TPA: ABC transporter ATP-binding protein, partial [Longimicrobiaceae bacterium]|nr:ABC transporter ATP-binding protein [Longimicrobiaceae bacterium]
VRGVSRVFGGHTALQDVSLEVRRGELFGVLGPNGSGKTTLTRMLTGLLQPTAGEVTVLGIDVRRDPDAVRAQVGYVSQAFGLYDDLTIDENLRFYAEVYGLARARKRERIDAVRALAGLGERRGQLAGTLSGGWKQRLALACALVHEPGLVLLDEPTAGVDPASRRHFWGVIRTLLARGTTVMGTTHYMDEAERFDRVAFLSRGRLTATGTPAEVVAGHPGAASLEDVFVALQPGGAPAEEAA